MNNNDFDEENPALQPEPTLRQRAEELAGENPSPERDGQRAPTVEEDRITRHELQVYQIELQMQNDELRRTQVRLEAARARYFDLYEHAPVGYCTISEKGLILETNLTAAGLLGVPRAALLNQPFTRYILQEDEDIFYLLRKQLFRTGEPQACELRMLKSDGAAAWMHLAATTARDELGAHVCRASLVDVTGRKQAEAALRESSESALRSEARLKQAQAIARVGDWTWDVKNSQIEWSDEMYRIFGIDKNSYTGRLGDVVQQVIHPDDLHLVLPSNAPAFAKKQPVEYRILRRDGSIRHILAESGAALLDEAGNPAFLTGTAQDITLRKQAEEALRASEERYRLAVEATADGLWEWNTLSGEVFYNPRWKSILELDEIEPSYAAWEARIHPDDRQAVSDSLAAHLQGKTELWRAEHRLRTDRGSWKWVLGRGRVVDRDIEGRPRRMIGTMADISERKQADLALIVRQKELEALHRISGIALRENALAFTLHQITQELASAVGFPIVAIEFYNESQDEMELVAAVGIPLPAGQTTIKIPLAQTLSGVVARSGQPLVETHATQRPEYASEELRALGVQTFICVPMFINARVLGTLSLASPEVLPNTEHLTPLAGSLANFIAIVVERKRMEEALEQERRALERRVAERTADLSIANAGLERAARQKDEFLASMSHELRTPLTGILGLSEALQLKVYGDLTPRQAHALKSIEESGYHLLSLINDILDLSKVEAGMIELELRPLNLASVCRESLRFIHQPALMKSIEIGTSFDPDISIILADERRLKQILVNLLSNAVKFTANGGSIGLETHGRAADHRVELIVWDTGIGIAPEDLPRLFKPFTQLDSRLSRAYNGTGLGLSLVLHMVKLHGGSVSVESEPGKGSRFTVCLPWNPEADYLSLVEAGLSKDRARLEKTKLTLTRAEHLGQASQPQHPPTAVTAAPLESPADRRAAQGNPELILLADDNDLNLNTISDFLQSRGYQVSAARNGQEALNRAHELHPGLILMDIQMPVLDGLAVTRLLRQAQDTQSIPIIALTALVMPGDRQRCLDAGANDYLSKPVNLEDLLTAIARLLA